VAVVIATAATSTTVVLALLLLLLRFRAESLEGCGGVLEGRRKKIREGKDERKTKG